MAAPLRAFRSAGLEFGGTRAYQVLDLGSIGLRFRV